MDNISVINKHDDCVHVKNTHEHPLTYYQQIGHLWEVQCACKLAPLVDDIKHNPFMPNDWVERQEKGPDIYLKVNGFKVVVECKDNHKPVYASWIKRDHLSRFDDASPEYADADYRVTVTSNKNLYSNECREAY